MSKLLAKDKRRLSEKNSFHISQMAISSQTSLPIGFIAMFSGAWTDNSTIPGWYKCDGNNGTINLVGKFIRGGTASGTTGGSDDAVVVTHNHQILVNIANGTSGESVNRNAYAPNKVLDSSLIRNSGESGTGKNIPAYYTLIFIQKIS